MSTCTVAYHDVRCELGESPVWDGTTNNLSFVDIKQRKVHTIRADSGAFCKHAELVFSEEVGTIAPIEGRNSMLVALARDILEVDQDTGATVKKLASVPAEACYDPASMRFNDGKASPAGVLVTGYMHAEWRSGKPGRLFSMRPGGLEASCPYELQEVLKPDEVVLPNGMAWDMDKGIMYFADSGKGTLTAYGCDGEGVPTRDEDGNLQARLVAHVPPEEGVPDGITIDATGNVWVTLGEKGAVACYDPVQGAQVQKVLLLCKRPTACTFGDPNLDGLYVTTRVESGAGASEHWGKLLVAHIPGVKGKAAAYAVRC